MLHKPFTHHLRLFETRRTWSGTSWLSLKNSSYEPQKWHIFKLSEAPMSKNGSSRCQNRFFKIFFWHYMKVFWGGNEVFRVHTTPQYVFMIIFWHFEGIWKNRKKSSLFNFFGLAGKQYMKDLANFEHEKFLKTFFFKNHEINRKSAPQTC